MFLLIVFLVVFVIILIKGYQGVYFDETFPIFFGFIGGLFALLPGCVVWAIIAMAIEQNPNNIYEKVEQTPIYSLETNANVEGNFVLGFGGVEENIKYYYYEKDEKDLYQLDSIYTSWCKLKLDDSVSPCIQRTYRKYHNKVLDFLFNIGHVDTIIIVPTSAIKKVYNGMLN